MKEANNIRRQFTVYPYCGITNAEYFFTVDTANQSLQRIESDLSGTHYIIARDMGRQVVITEIDSQIKTNWQNNNGWTNITVIKPGIARKFQALAMPRGDIAASALPSATDYAAANEVAYTSPNNVPTPIFNSTKNGINDLLQIGFATTTISNNNTKNLPFATFYAVNDPVVISYTSGGLTYTRAIKNRIDETTLF